MKIFSGSSNTELAEKIARELSVELSRIENHVFPDGERRIKLQESVVGEDTIVVQSTATPVDQNYIELFFIIDALKRSGAKSVTAVIPYLGYQRQDHVFRDGEAVSLQVMIGMLESMEVKKVIVIDLHTIKIPEFFHIPIIHLSALSLFAEQIKGIGTQDSVLVSPDMGGLRRINIISEMLSNMPWIATVKDRDLATGAIEIKEVQGEMPSNTKRAFVVDDMVSSGGTLVKAAELLKKQGVSQVYAFITHPIFARDAHSLLQNSAIEKVFVTDSVYVPESKVFSKLEILSISKMIANELKV